MAYYSLAMLTLAVILAERDPVYDDMVVKFTEQSMLIMEALENSGCYDPDDGFFYDRLTDATGNQRPRSGFRRWSESFPRCQPSPFRREPSSGWSTCGSASPGAWSTEAGARSWTGGSAAPATIRRLLLSVVPPDRLARILTTLFDEQAFLSPYGLRSVSKRHTDALPGAQPARRDHRLRARGVPDRHVRRQLELARARLVPGQLPGHPRPAAVRPVPRRGASPSSIRPGRDEQSPSATSPAIWRDRLVSIWLPGPDGRRPVYGGVDQLQTDPAWRNNLLFYEYFHGDNGAGLGAMHQTGWTALVADLLLDPPGRSHRQLFHDPPLRDQR